jgi:nucleotide-binding universal stress UspA family protein
MFKMILLALDESEKARRAVDITADLAKRYGAEVVVEHIWEDALITAPPVQRHPAPAFPQLSGTSWSRSRLSGFVKRGSEHAADSRRSLTGRAHIEKEDPS